VVDTSIFLTLPFLLGRGFLVHRPTLKHPELLTKALLTKAPVFFQPQREESPASVDYPVVVRPTIQHQLNDWLFYWYVLSNANVFIEVARASATAIAKRS